MRDWDNAQGRRDRELQEQLERERALHDTSDPFAAFSDGLSVIGQKLGAMRVAVLNVIDGSVFTKWAKEGEEPFSFCIGRPWAKHETSRPSVENICAYAYGAQVYYGNMEYAEEFRKCVEERTGEKQHIYKLVKVA